MALCPNCKLDRSVRKPGRGKTPFCEPCRRVRIDPNHYDANGVRFGTSGRVVMLTCHYCSSSYERRKNEFSVERKYIPVCLSCVDKHISMIAPVKKALKKKCPSMQPDYLRRRRIKKKLQKLDISVEWYDQQVSKGCGICGTPNPGRGWCIDHNHSCCPYGSGCKKCIRGILCTPCNFAIGLMRDDPERLRKAADYLDRSTSNS